ncbi:MAG TPA: RNA methyltransferase [Candidatus Avimonas sp.]|nr:RNA methyltransferase [Clostridiales bacterium]HPU58609.1 RNA methyltransferase [Candidatus Avimonas sp.]
MITSRNNQQARHVKRLLSDAGYRRREQLFAIEGARLCADAALSGVKIRSLLYTPQAESAYPAQIALLKEKSESYLEISPEVSKSIGDTQSPQGVFCVCDLLDNRHGLDKILGNKHPAVGYLALENIQDPSNLGAIVRTAEALGISGLLLSEGCCDIYNPKVLRGSMGGVFRLPFYFVGNMADAVQGLVGSGISCFAAVVGDGAVPVTKLEFPPGCVCVIGNEGSGLLPKTVSACSGKITIPMLGKAESLNAAMAAGIIMWEMARAVIRT